MKKQYKVLIICLATLAGTILTLFLITSYSFKNDLKAYDNVSKSIHSISTFSQPKSIQDVVRFDEINDYSRSIDGHLLDLEKLNSKLNNSPLVSLFRESQRDSLCSKANKLIKYHRELSRNCTTAVSELQPLHNTLNGSKLLLQKHRSTMSNLLQGESDISDFKSYQAEIPPLKEAVAEYESQIKDLINKHDYKEYSDTLFRMAINGFLLDARDQKKEYDDDTKALTEVTKKLKAYKSEMLRTINRNHGLFSLVQLIINEYGPLVRTIDSRLEPLHVAFDRLDEPISSNRTLGLFTGGASEMSALELLSNADPITGRSINSVKKVCDGIQNLDKEISTINSVTRPYLESVREFRRSHSRLAQITVVQKSPNLANYILSKQNLFDPITKELDKGMDAIEQIDRYTNQITVRKAKDYIEDFTFIARDVMFYAYYPFERWKGYVHDIASPLEELVALEKNYNTFLGSINPAFSTTKSMRIESNNIVNKRKSITEPSTTSSNRISSKTSDLPRKQILVQFETRLSKNDHYNSRGEFLNDAPAIIQQDRANYHRFLKRDQEDGYDSYFTTLERRTGITQYLHSIELSDRLVQEIIQGTPKIKVILFEDKSIQIELID